MDHPVRTLLYKLFLEPFLLLLQRPFQWRALQDFGDLPEDYDGYMKQFDVSVDAVIRQYVSEALDTYIRGTFFASGVMIGGSIGESHLHGC